MVYPLASTRYHRPHPYEERPYEERTEERTHRFSVPINYNSSHYSTAPESSWRHCGSYEYNDYSTFEYDADSELRRNWDDAEYNNYQDRYDGRAPVKNIPLRSFPASTSSHSDLEYFNRNGTYQGSNSSTGRNKSTGRSRTRLHEVGVSPNSHHISQQASSCGTKDQNTAREDQRQNYSIRAQFCDGDRDFEYDSHFGYAKKGYCSENVEEKVTTKTPKIQNRTNILTCLICSEEVKRRDIKGHLLFGSVQCQSCPWSTTNCKDFSERHKNRYQCSHNKLQWAFIAVEQIVNNIEINTKQLLNDYLASTIALKYYAPYDFAYNHLQSIVYKMHEEEYEEPPALIDGEFAEKSCHDRVSDAGVDSEDNSKGSKSSKESANTSLQNLSQLVTFNQSQEPHIVQYENSNNENDVELLTVKKIAADPVSRTFAKKEYLDSSTSSRMPKNKRKTSKIVSVKDKHKTLIIGAPSHDTHEAKNSAVSPEKKAEIEYNLKDRDILPSFVTDNYVLTDSLSDDCPQCYATFTLPNVTLDTKSDIVVAKCAECSLYVCFRHKIFEAYRSSLNQ